MCSLIASTCVNTAVIQMLVNRECVVHDIVWLIVGAGISFVRTCAYIRMYTYVYVHASCSYVIHSGCGIWFDLHSVARLFQRQ